MPQEPERPLVSIIIPCFNHQELLTRAIQSCLTQTHTNIEVIVIDDGSKTPIYIPAEFAHYDSKIKLNRIKNSGVCTARNHGLAIATGSYVKFLDADDELMPECIATQLSLLENSKHSACFIGFKVVYGEKSVTGVGKFDDFLTACLMGNIAPLHSGLFKTQLVRDVNGFDCPNDSITLVEDHYFHIKLAITGINPVTAHEVGVIYHKQVSGRSAAGKALFLGRLAILKHTLLNHQDTLKTDLNNIVACLLGILENTIQSSLYEEALELLHLFQFCDLSHYHHRTLLDLSILSREKHHYSLGATERKFWAGVRDICPDHRICSPKTLISPNYALRDDRSSLVPNPTDGELIIGIIKKAQNACGVWLWGLTPLTSQWLSMTRIFGIQVYGIIDSFGIEKTYLGTHIYSPEQIDLNPNDCLIICSKESYFDIRLAAVKKGWEPHILDYVASF